MDKYLVCKNEYVLKEHHTTTFYKEFRSLDYALGWCVGKSRDYIGEDGECIGRVDYFLIPGG